eukprot:jgi/Mesen1/6134/ME000313S05259
MFSRKTAVQGAGKELAQPIRLVYTDQNGRFVMDLEAVAALKKVKGPVGVVAVCGRARQGKSFILNQLLGRSNGFQVGPTHRPCTKGLWIWSAPVPRESPEGKYHLLLLDTEGIDSYDQTGTYSTQIFSLAVLLSSLFVYNQMGGIDEAALDRLSLVTEMTKRIHGKTGAGGGASPAGDLAQFCPAFLWLLRDFYLDLEEEGGRRITAREYLEAALQPAPGSSPAVIAKNEIRESIRMLFPDRDCFTLVRPLNDEKQLQQLDRVPMERMRPEFRQGLEALTDSIFARARPKRMGDTILTGGLLAALAQAYLDALNAGAVPTISTSWQSVAESECRRAHDAALDAYHAAFDKSAPPTEAALGVAQEAAVRRAMGVFADTAVASASCARDFEARLQAAMAKSFQEHSARVYAEAELACARQVGHMEAQLSRAAHSSTATLDSVLQLLDGLLAEYEHKVEGPAKWQHLAAFMHKSFGGVLRDLVDRRAQQASAELAASEAQVKALRERVSAVEQQLAGSQEDVHEWKARQREAAAQHADAAQSLASLEAQSAGLSKQLNSALAAAASWQAKHEALEERAAAVRRTLEAQLQSAGSQTAEQRRRAEALEEQQRAAARSQEQQQQQLASASQKLSEHTSAAAAYQEQLQHTKSELSAARAEVQNLQAAAVAMQESSASSGRELQAAARVKQQQLEAELRLAQQRASAAEDELARQHLAAKRNVERAERFEKMHAASEAEVQLLRRRVQAAEQEKGDHESKMGRLMGNMHSNERHSEGLQKRLADAEERLRQLLQDNRDAVARGRSAEKSAEDLKQQVHEKEVQMATLQNELTTSKAHEAALEDELKSTVSTGGETPRRGKRAREPEPTDGLSHEAEGAGLSRQSTQRRKLDAAQTQTPVKEETKEVEEVDPAVQHQAQAEGQDAVQKLTKQELKRRLTDMGYGHEVLALRNPSKPDLVSLYVKHLDAGV